MTHLSPTDATTRTFGVRVLGNLNYDLLLSGVGALPEWGREVLGSARALLVAGQAGYIASALGYLDVPTAICGVVGDDADGGELRAGLAAIGVDVAAVRVVPGRTGLTIALIREDGERAFVSDLGVSAQATRADFLGFLEGSAAEYTILAGTSNTPGLTTEDLADILVRASQDSRTVFDPGWAPDGYSPRTQADTLDLLEFVDLYVPNEDEAMAVTGSADLHAAVRMLAARVRCDVVVKCGAQGSVVLVGDTLHRVSSRRIVAANAVGAGDTYDAALVAALRDGHAIVEAMSFASAAAAHFVERAENRYPRRADLC